MSSSASVTTRRAVAPPRQPPAPPPRPRRRRTRHQRRREAAAAGALDDAASSDIARAIESSEVSRSLDRFLVLRAAGPRARRDGSASSFATSSPLRYCRVRQYLRRSCDQMDERLRHLQLDQLLVVVGRPDERRLALALGRARGRCTRAPARRRHRPASVRNCFLKRVFASRAKSAGVSGTSSSLVAPSSTYSMRVGRPVLVDVRIAVEREPPVQIARRGADRARTPGSCGFPPPCGRAGWRRHRRCRARPGRACRRRAPPASRCGSGTP